VKYGTFEKESPPENSGSGDTETVKRGYLRGYTVFNSSQIDGIEFPEIKHPDYEPSEQVALAQKIIDDMPNPLRLEEGPHACAHYRPVEDFVGMSARETFTSEERFCKSLFHEFYADIGIRPTPQDILPAWLARP
jgi:antirestriction protein ArdC